MNSYVICVKSPKSYPVLSIEIYFSRNEGVSEFGRTMSVTRLTGKADKTREFSDLLFITHGTFKIR